MLLKIMKTVIFSFALFFYLSPFSVAATYTIWSEDFHNYAQGSTVGQNYNTANSAIDWTTNTTNADPKWFEVRNSHFIVFGGKDTNGPVTWTSEVINISNWYDVNLSLDVGETGFQNHDDFIKVLYLLDGNKNTLFYQSGEFTSAVLSRNLYGDALQIIIEIDNDHSDEFHYFDNILVTGETVPPSTVPVPTSLLLLGSGILGLAGFRRKNRL